MKRRGHFLVGGRVQGVCFRMCAVEQAERLNVTGWVRNIHGGRVEIVAEGEEADLEEFHKWTRLGPIMAVVSEVKAEYSDATGEFISFTIQ